MPKIIYPQVEAIVESFETLVDACNEYCAFLESRRPAAYRTAESGGVFVNGRFQSAEPDTPVPPHGTPEFEEFAINRLLERAIGQTRAFLELLEGPGYDRMRPIVDGLGSIASAYKGEWV